MKKLISCFLFLILIDHTHAQLSNGSIQQILNSDEKIKQLNILYPSEVKEVYSSLNYKTIWDDSKNLTAASALLGKAKFLGLNKAGYNTDYLKDTNTTDIKFTDAFIHFLHDLAYGNQAPSLSYDGIKFIPSGFNIPSILVSYITSGKLNEITNALEPALPVYIAAKEKLNILLLRSSEEIKDQPVISSKLSVENKPLINKLFLLGIIEDLNDSLTNKKLEESVTAFQKQFDLLADGKLRSTVMDALNVSVEKRISLLNISINYYRWLNSFIQPKDLVLVNIPSAELKIYNNKDIILRMRIIAGKPSTPTPTFSSIINEVILYPYWVVPHKIAVKELLPLIKADRAFLDMGNYQIINKQGKILDPATIHWKNLNSANFPYIIRQSTGCDNALGLIKINFYSPFDVYLHDTPIKGLFMAKKRYFSHGCMRLEDANSLAKLLLKNNTIAIDTLMDKGSLLHQEPVNIPATNKIPLVVWYNPVDIDESGKLIFYDDPYNKFK